MSSTPIRTRSIIHLIFKNDIQITNFANSLIKISKGSKSNYLSHTQYSDLFSYINNELLLIQTMDKINFFLNKIGLEIVLIYNFTRQGTKYNGDLIVRSENLNDYGNIEGLTDAISSYKFVFRKLNIEKLNQIFFPLFIPSDYLNEKEMITLLSDITKKENL